MSKEVLKGQIVDNLETTFLPVLENNKNSLDIVWNEDKFELKGIDDFEEEVDRILELVKEYEYKEEDRGTIRSLKATNNKFIKEFKANIKAKRDFIFGDVDRDVKRVERKLTDLSSVLASGIAESDAKDRQEKAQALGKVFDSALSHYENLSSTKLVLDDILEPSWLNRSASNTKAIKDLGNRMKTLDNLLADEVVKKVDLYQIISVLEQNDFDGLSSLMQIQKEEKECIEKEEQLKAKLKEDLLREQQEKERLEQEKVKEKEVVSYSTIKVKKTDLALVRRLLENNDVEFEVL